MKQKYRKTVSDRALGIIAIGVWSGMCATSLFLSSAVDGTGVAFAAQLGKSQPPTPQNEGRAGSGADTSSSKKSAFASKNKEQNPVNIARGILREIESVEHPENRIPADSIGSQEERAAATKSSQDRLLSAQARLTALGSSIAPLLASSLTSPNHDVVQICTTVLEQFGNASVPPLIDVIKKSGPIPSAVQVLKGIGADSLPPLVEMMKSSDQFQVLCGLKTVDALLPESAGYRRSRRVFIYTSSMRVNSANDIVLPLSVVEQICHLSTKDKTVKFREELAQVLGKIGPRSPVVVDTLCAMVGDEQPSVREAALRSLGSAASLQTLDQAPRSVSILVNSLKKDDYEGCRTEAAMALGKLPGSADVAVPALTEALKDGYVEVSTAALGALSSFGDRASTSLPALLKFIQESPDAPAASNAMRAIGRMKSGATPALPLIGSTIQSGNQQMQLSAMSAVESLGPAAASTVKPLISLLKSDDSSIKFAAIRALGAIGPQASEAVPMLREMLKSPRFEKAVASQALRKITGSNEDDAANSMRNAVPSGSGGDAGTWGAPPPATPQIIAPAAPASSI